MDETEAIEDEKKGQPRNYGFRNRSRAARQVVSRKMLEKAGLRRGEDRDTKDYLSQKTDVAHRIYQYLEA